MSDEIVNAVKLGSATLLGSIVSLPFLPGGTRLQKDVSFVASMGIGCLGGGAAVEYFSLVPGSYLHMMAVASSAVFGLSVVHNAMQKLPLVIPQLLKRFFGIGGG